MGEISFGCGEKQEVVGNNRRILAVFLTGPMERRKEWISASLTRRGRLDFSAPSVIIVE
jgi:hypothetical protein